MEVADDRDRPRRPGTVISGDRDERRIHTPPRGVGLTEPPPRRAPSYGGWDDGHTPPVTDPETFRAIRRLRDEMLTADRDQNDRLSKVENKLGDVAESHARMEGAFSVMTTTITEEREEKKQLRAHKRRVTLRWLQIIGAATSSGGLVVVIVIALLGKC